MEHNFIYFLNSEDSVNPRSPALEASTRMITLPMRVFGEHFWSVSQRIHIFHFVVDCPLYENIRVKFFDKVIDLCFIAN
jgi:hypothetical protein